MSPADAEQVMGCTSDKLCAELLPVPATCADQECTTTEAEADTTHEGLRLSGGPMDTAHATYAFSDLPDFDQETTVHLWPNLIRWDGGVLAGVETAVRAMYSGGGASSSTLHLIAFLPGQPPLRVLSVPYNASVLIRACFSERDMKQRAGACHDEYSFAASLLTSGTSVAGLPVLRYRSKATSFPGRVSRSQDSLAGRPLRQRDIVTVTDPRCSYQRQYRFDPQARSYLPDKPLPDCSDYTVP